jgi:Uma2 family endonuclease
MEALLEQLLKSPKLGLYRQQIDDVLRREHAARQAFYEEITDKDKAEFINGQAVFHSPVRLSHSGASDGLLFLLKGYVDAKNLGYVGHEKLMISLTRNDYEPDLCFWTNTKCSAFQPNQLRFPAPDLIVEVLSGSTETNDRGVKFEDYAAHGVGEYWIVDADKLTVEQYVLEHDRYELLIKAGDGHLTSRMIEGFTIPATAIFDRSIQLDTLLTLTK